MRVENDNEAIENARYVARAFSLTDIDSKLKDGDEFYKIYDLPALNQKFDIIEFLQSPITGDRIKAMDKKITRDVRKHKLLIIIRDITDYTMLIMNAVAGAFIVVNSIRGGIYLLAISIFIYVIAVTHHTINASKEIEIYLREKICDDCCLGYIMWRSYRESLDKEKEGIHTNV